MLTWLALVGFGLLGLSLLLFVVAFTFRTVQRVGVGKARPARRVVRYLSDGRQVADEGYTELAERWRESEPSAARYAALNQLDFALGGIFEVAYEDPELDEWMQDVYRHVRDRELMAEASELWLSVRERDAVEAQRESREELL